MAQERKKNVFLLGDDEFHRRYLARLELADRVAFHPLLRSDEVVYQESYDVDGLLDRARAVLDRFDGPVDGIITHWDFPALSMLSILCAERGLPAPSLESVLRCSHKYWSRLEQRKVAPECVPDFCAVDPFDPRAHETITLDYPFWIKPVKGYGSALGFRVDDESSLRKALAAAREKIERLGGPVNDLLAKIDLPAEVRGVGGNHMIAESLVGGKELAPEGYVHAGRFHSHGLVDVDLGENGKSLERIFYPSRAPDPVRRRVEEISEAVLGQIGFDNGCFNVEFFWDRDSDRRRDGDDGPDGGRLWIVEINPRVSQSHSNLFEKVDGTSNHAVAVQVALGEEPHFHHGGGPHRCAAKIWYRRYDGTDAVVKRVPAAEDIERLQARQNDTEVQLVVQPGERLSELLDQDAYSYVLAELHIGAESERELDARFQEARELLPFEFSPCGEGADAAR